MAAVVRPAATPLGLEIGDIIATTMGNGKVAAFADGSVVVQYSFGRGFMSSLSVAKASIEPKAGQEVVELISRRGNKRMAYAAVGALQLGSSASGMGDAAVAQLAPQAQGQVQQANRASTQVTHGVAAMKTPHGSYKRARQYDWQ